MSGVTMDELLKEVGVSPTQLDKACTSEHLQDIALFLESWRTVAPHLGLSRTEVEGVERDATEEKERRQKFLEVWKARFAFKAKYVVLIEALLKIGRADQAEQVCRLLAPQQAKEGQRTPPPEGTPLTPPPETTPSAPLTPQSSVGADSPQPSPSVEELPSQPPTYQSPSQPPTYQPPSQPPTYQPPSQPPRYQPPSQPPTYQPPSQPPTYQLESAQVQPLSIEEEIKEFEEKYARLVQCVLVAFQQGSVSFTDIKARLMALPISLQPQFSNLVQNKARQLSEASSISELFFILSGSPFWNFYNPYLLSHLVDRFGNRQTKQQKDKYLEELRGFRMRTKVDDFMGKWTSASQPDSQELVLELQEEVWRKRKLEQLEPFQHTLSHKRSREESGLPLPLKCIRVSSINAVFSLPRSIDAHNLHLEDLREFFLSHQVLRVLLDGVCILDLRDGGGDGGDEAVDPITNLGGGATVQPEEEAESDWEDQGEDEGETVRGEQEGEVAHGGAGIDTGVGAVGLQGTTANLGDDGGEDEGETNRGEQGTDHSASTRAVSQTAKDKQQHQKQPSRELSSEKHERLEKKILRMLTERNTRLKPTALPEEDSEGMIFRPKYGYLTARRDVMVIVSVGSKHPPGVRVEERVRDKARATCAFKTYGKVPRPIASLQISRETAADLKVVSSHVQKSVTLRDISLKLDVPNMQRPKEYYITAIANFLKQCRQPGAMIWYMGHSEEGTGNWCFKDGTISFQEIFDLYTTHSPGKLLSITSDCCYSGNWVHRCTETLDNKLGIPPCGHKARERGVLIKVCASCRSNEKAAEPCYSTDGVYVDANTGIPMVRRDRQLIQHQTVMCADFTTLVCCRDPGSPCPAEGAFQNWKWDDAVRGEMRRNIRLVRGKDKGRPAWHYVLLSSGDEDHVQGFNAQVRTGTIDASDWGYIIASGWGEDPPDNKVDNWTRVGWL